MSDRRPVTVRCDRQVWAKFERFVEQAEDSNRGAKPKHLEKALQQYMGDDQLSRIEGKVDQLATHLRENETTHTHKRSSESVEKAFEIAERIQKNHSPVVPEADVNRAIEDIGGGDPRTVEKYKEILRNRELLFEHPGDSVVWTTEREQWVQWTVDFTDNNGVDIHNVLDDYEVTHSEFIELAEQ